MKIKLSPDFIQDKAWAYRIYKVAETLMMLTLGWPATSSPYWGKCNLLNVMELFLKVYYSIRINALIKRFSKITLKITFS